MSSVVRWRDLLISALALSTGCSPASLDKSSSLHTSTEIRAPELVPADIPELDASIITSGTLNASIMPAFTGGDVTSSAGSSVLTIAAGAVNSSKLLDGAVSTTKIFNGAVTEAKLAALSVTSTKLSADIGVWTKNSGKISYSTGNVGIGTSDPGQLLSVNGNAQIPALFGGAGATQTLSLKNTSGNTNYSGIDIGSLYNNDNGGISFFTAGESVATERVRIMGTTGNVGIGTTTDPSAKLEVAGQVKITGGSPGAGKILTSDGQGLASWEPLPVAEVSQWTTSGANIHFNSGNVGIGTTVPAKEFHVFGSSGNQAIFEGTFNAGIDIRARGNEAGHVAYLDFATNSTGVGTPDYNARIAGFGDNSLRIYSSDQNERIRMTSTGNVGIGTTSPAAKLDLRFGTAEQGILVGGAASATGETTAVRGINVDFASNNNTLQLDGIRSSIHHNLSQGGTAVNGSFTGVVYAGGSGATGDSHKHGIGVFGQAIQANMSGHGVAVGVQGLVTGVLPIDDPVVGSTYAGYFENTTEVTGNNVGVYISTSSGGSYGLYQAGQAKNYFSGSVGIGTATPSSKLEIVSSTVDESSTALRLKSLDGSITPGQELRLDFNQGITPTARIGMTYFDGANWGLNFYGLYNGSLSTTPTMSVQGNGNVGIGTTTPSAKLEIGEQGDGSSALANAWNTFSDLRLKRDLEKIPNACDMIDQLSGYYYFWKDGKDSSRQVGVVAQEVEKVLPELVKTGSDGIKTVDYSKLTAVLIEASKEQNREIANLQARIDRLEKMILEKK